MCGWLRMSVGAPSVLGMDDTDRRLLTLATTHYRYPAARAEQVQREYGLSEPRFWARVHWLCGRAEVEREMPREVRQLRRLREGRAAVR